MRRPALTLVLVAVAILNGQSALRSAEPDREGVEFFEKKIRPVLVKHCYACHSTEAEQIEGGLVLDSREGIRTGGDSGHAVVPGDLKESLLIGALRFEDFEMPPDEQLPDTVIADFEKWIKMGAPDPRDDKMPVVKPQLDLDKARQFWSLQPLSQASPPTVKDPEWGRNAIDRYVLARLESHGLQPARRADPRVLVRRVYFDLTGLPPTPAQVDEFVADPSPEAFARLVDRLLDSSRFGERWGRHWLDVVRYGESTGMERNFTFPYAWRYRDYVIAAFNDDKPFDRFIVEQIAGDLLPAENTEQRNEQLIATGLLAIGTKSLNEPNREKFLMDVVDEQIDVTTQAFLAFTASCARCHDHKFDPIPHEDYYALAGIFRSTDTLYGTGKINGNRQQGQLLALAPSGLKRITPGGPGKGKAQNAKALKQQAGQLAAAKRRLAQLRKNADKNPAAAKRLAATETQIARLQKQVRKARQADAEPAPTTGNADTLLVMATQDAARPADTELRVRGEANDRGKTIPRGFLSVLNANKPPVFTNKTSGRLEYARWIASADNPLTARVTVNRVWMHLFGSGLVTSVNNFGASGDRPSHPQLLDHLAAEFIETGWSVKQLVRSITNTRVYQMTSASNPQGAQIDPDNRLLWRANQRRLEVEAIRDAILMTSGQLDLTPGKGSIVETIGDGNVGRNLRPDQFAVQSRQRSVYLPIVRGAVPEILQVFDFPDPSMIYGQREVTTVPTQALFMMNSPFVIEQAARFADRVLAAGQLQPDQRVELAYRLALARVPTGDEVAAATEFLRGARKSFAGPSAQPADANAKAWASFCQTLFACSEFRYVD